MDEQNIKKELFKQYDRTYKNFDRLMECLYDITLFCAGRKDYVIAGIIEDCLNDLEKVDKNKINRNQSTSIIQGGK